MTQVQLIKKMGFTKNVTAEVKEAMEAKTTKAAKNNLSRMEEFNFYFIFASEDRFTVHAGIAAKQSFHTTKEEIKMIEAITGLKFVRVGTLMDENGAWDEWCKQTEVGSDEAAVETAEVIAEEVAEEITEEAGKEVAEEMENETSIYIPKKYRHMLQLIEKDDDGYWAYSRPGYYFPPMECHTVREDNQKDFLSMIRTIEPCTCRHCKKGEISRP